MKQEKTTLLSNDSETIVAQCTAQGPGALALLRLSGINAVFIADKLAKLSSKKTLQESKSHTIHHGHVVREDGNIIDEVLFFLMHGPKTFTGQNTVEISCHNNQFIIDEIIARAVHVGARLAKAGEFAKRAFLNNKIDLVQAESINEIIHAPTQLALQKALAQLQGSLSNHCHKIEQYIIELLSLVESTFEFLDEEQRDLEINHTINLKIKTIIDYINSVKASYNRQQQIKEGIRIAIIGSVNAGKSTLFNALLQRNRAIVSNIEGTTRDSIEANLYRNGQFWTIIDTAGLRSTGDVIELKGIERTYEEADQADIILLVYDASRPLQKQEENVYSKLYKKYKQKTILLANKSSNAITNHNLANEAVLHIEAKNNAGIIDLENTIKDSIQELFQELNSPYLINQRQYNILIEIEKHFKFIANSHSNNIEYELVAYHIKDILNKVSEITGKNISESILDTVFSKFCIGK